MKHHLEFIEYLIRKDGPLPSDYNILKSWLRELGCEVRKGKLSQDDINIIRSTFKEAVSKSTIQGFSLEKPHGYPGDYEIIEKIYLNAVSQDKRLKNWDIFFHTQDAPNAVRNRKQYFVQLLKNLESTDKRDGSIPVLNIASGPARDIYDFMEKENDGRIILDCIDHDPDSIAYAKNLCNKYLNRISFAEANAFKVDVQKKYRLVWSAGLFDYLDGRKFIFLLNKLIQHLEEDGEVVIGNFSDINPTRDYMEIIGDWYLYHRDPDNLVLFAEQCGINRSDIYIGKEPLGINLFLHIKKGKEFIIPPDPDAYFPK